MSKKIVLRLLLCVFFLTLVATTAHAYPAFPGGWGASFGSVCVWAEWKGVANYEKTPTEAIVTLRIDKVQLHYLNPAGQPGGIGNPFYPDVNITIPGYPTPDTVEKNGKWYMNICFNNDELYDLVKDYAPPPPNDNWTLDEENPITILEMYVTIVGCSDLDGDGFVPESETAHVAGPCILSYDGTFYTCETEEEWGWTKKYPDYPPEGEEWVPVCPE